jgi:WXG100 family type VII secretion target
MPDISNIDSEKIISAASQLDSVVDRVQGCVGKFADAIQNLDKGWVSEVKAGFMANYQLDFEAMQEMLFQLREINDSLRDAAGDFDKTEGEITTAVKVLR